MWSGEVRGIITSLLLSTSLGALDTPASGRAYDERALEKSLAAYQPEQQQRFVIIVPSYNNNNNRKVNVSGHTGPCWYQKNLDSIFAQVYTNYRIVYLDDCSTDGTAQAVERYVRDNNQQHRFTLVRNAKNIGGLGNIYQAVYSCSDTEICVELDGDDWFKHDRVLELLNKVYTKYPEVWLTYGQFEMTNGQHGSELGYGQLDPAVIARHEYRSAPWVSSALRTWRSWLFKRIDERDLLYRNSFFPMAWDQAFMLPMLEMCGSGDHTFFIPDTLYVYNVDNAINDFRKNGQMQGQMKWIVRQKKPYTPLAFDFVPPHLKPDPRFAIIVPSYKNSEWCERNIQSIFEQTYTNYHVYYVDDCSPDDTAVRVATYVQDQGSAQARFTLVTNSTRQGALYNLYTTIHQACADFDIVVMLDGDDWFASPEVLEILAGVYRNADVWLTYGQFRLFPTGEIGKCRAYPPDIIAQNNFRAYEWVASHLRTCYAWLFKKIHQTDLMYRGEFFPMTWDMALMFPMLEMAGEHARCITDVLYEYNVSNPINDQNVNPMLQGRLAHVIRAMPRYMRVQSAPTR